MNFNPVDVVSNALAAEKKIVTDSARSVCSIIKAEPDLFSKPGVAVAETLKEGLFTIPLTNIGKISSWVLKGMGNVLWGTVKVGAQLAMMAPLPIPLPAGCATMGEVVGKIEAAKYALLRKAQGDPKGFGNLMDEFFGTMNGVRNAAQAIATASPVPS